MACIHECCVQPDVYPHCRFSETNSVGGAGAHSQPREVASRPPRALAAPPRRCGQKGRQNTGESALFPARRKSRAHSRERPLIHAHSGGHTTTALRQPHGTTRRQRNPSPRSAARAAPARTAQPPPASSRQTTRVCQLRHVRPARRPASAPRTGTTTRSNPVWPAHHHLVGSAAGWAGRGTTRRCCVWC